MKCPHCKKPVHVRQMCLGKGRTQYMMNPSLQNKANRAARHLKLALNMLRKNGFTLEEVAKVLGINSRQVCYLAKREIPDDVLATQESK